MTVVPRPAAGTETLTAPLADTADTRASVTRDLTSVAGA